MQTTKKGEDEAQRGERKITGEKGIEKSGAIKQTVMKGRRRQDRQRARACG